MLRVTLKVGVAWGRGYICDLASKKGPSGLYYELWQTRSKVYITLQKMLCYSDKVVVFTNSEMNDHLSCLQFNDYLT